MGRAMIIITCGKDGIERASLAFVVGKTALNSGQSHRPAYHRRGQRGHQRL